MGYVIGHPYEFLKANPGIGAPVVSWGGYYTEKNKRRRRIMLTDARVDPGNSGSPLLNSVNFAVEGIVWAREEDPADSSTSTEVTGDKDDDPPRIRLGFVSPSFRLYDFFDRLNNFP